MVDVVGSAQRETKMRTEEVKSCRIATRGFALFLKCLHIDKPVDRHTWVIGDKMIDDLLSFSVQGYVDCNKWIQCTGLVPNFPRERERGWWWSTRTKKLNTQG